MLFKLGYFYHLLLHVWETLTLKALCFWSAQGDSIFLRFEEWNKAKVLLLRLIRSCA